MSKLVSLKPRLSEKAYAMSKSHRTYVFEVPFSANKLTVAEAVKDQFKVEVFGVRVANIKGKAKRTIYKGGGKAVAGKQQDKKRAFVTLKEGNQIPIYAAIEEAEAKEKKAEEKAAKAEAKGAK